MTNRELALKVFESIAMATLELKDPIAPIELALDEKDKRTKELEKETVGLAGNALDRSFKNAELINKDISADKLMNKMAKALDEIQKTTDMGNHWIAKEALAEFKAWKEKQ